MCVCVFWCVQPCAINPVSLRSPRTNRARRSDPGQYEDGVRSVGLGRGARMRVVDRRAAAPRSGWILLRAAAAAFLCTHSFGLFFLTSTITAGAFAFATREGGEQAVDAVVRRSEETGRGQTQQELAGVAQKRCSCVSADLHLSNADLHLPVRDVLTSCGQEGRQGHRDRRRRARRQAPGRPM